MTPTHRPDDRSDHRSDDRLEALEMRIAHQDATIEDLNAAVTAQWKVIDRLKREVVALTERVSAASLHAARDPREEPPPPHY
jgi:SlyX protein